MDPRTRNRGRLPSFFKVVMEPGIDHLALPPAFISKYNGRIPDRFILVDKYGRSWEVMRGICEDGKQCFGKGWTDVAVAWEIRYQDFILFNPISQTTIRFKVFFSNCCEKSLMQFVGTCISDPSSSDTEPEDHHCAMTHWRTGGTKCCTTAGQGKDRRKDKMVKPDLESKNESERTDVAKMCNRNFEQRRRCDGSQKEGDMLPTNHRSNHHRRTPKRMNQPAAERLGKGKRVVGSFSVQATRRHVEQLVMNIPRAMVRKLPNKTTTIKLLVPDSDKHWFCTYTIDKGSPRINMRGWRVVVNEASIQVGDILKFDLLNIGPDCIELMFHHSTTNPADV